MQQYTTPFKTHSVPFKASGVFYGVVVAVNDKRLDIKVPRMTGDAVFKNVEYADSAVTDTPVAGELLLVSFLEGRKDDLVVLGRVKSSLDRPDVDLTGAVAGDFLQYDGTKFIAADIDLGSLTVGNYVATIAGTANEIDVSGSGVEGAAITLSLPATINADTTGSAAKWTNSRTITLGGDLTGSVSFDGSADATLTATVAANSVALGTDTTGDYVGTITAGTGVSISSGSGTGEGSTPTLAIGQSVDTSATPSFSTITSTVATGTAPLTVASTTAVTNLNADLLDGQHGSFYTNQYTYSTAAPSSPTVGQTYYDTDNGQLLVYYGASTGWKPPWNQPWGVQGSASTTSAGSSITSVTDVSGLVLTTPTQVAGRLLKWTIQGHIQNGSTSDTASLSLWSGTSGGSNLTNVTTAGPSIWAYYVSYVYLETSTAAALSRRVRISRGDGSSSTVNFYADSGRPGRLICEDIGPASTTPPGS